MYTHKEKLFTVTPGKGVTSEPVAIRMFLALTVSVPLAPLTSTLLGATMVPTPLTRFTCRLKNLNFKTKNN